MLCAKINSIMSSSYCETMDLVKISSTQSDRQEGVWDSPGFSLCAMPLLVWRTDLLSEIMQSREQYRQIKLDKLNIIWLKFRRNLFQETRVMRIVQMQRIQRDMAKDNNNLNAHFRYPPKDVYQMKLSDRKFSSKRCKERDPLRSVVHVPRSWARSTYWSKIQEQLLAQIVRVALYYCGLPFTFRGVRGPCNFFLIY